MYLEQRAEEDALFAKKYRNPAKNMDECVTHILNYVQKSGCNGFTDGEIFGQAIIHLATSRMPFGGVGHSGMGGYHGRDSFRCFTHDKSIVKKALWLDLPMRYTPYSKKKETLIRFFLK